MLECLVHIAVISLVYACYYQVVHISGTDVGWHLALHQVVHQVTHAQHMLQGYVCLYGVKPVTSYHRTQIGGVYHFFVLQCLSQSLLEKVVEIGCAEHHQQGQETAV